jgi:predicted DNA-binding protein (UPF0251 family)
MINLDDLITQADAARLRGVSRASINELVKKGRFKVYTVAGQPLLSRTQVMNYEPDVGGRPVNNGRKKTARR